MHNHSLRIISSLRNTSVTQELLAVVFLCNLCACAAPAVLFLGINTTHKNASGTHCSATHKTYAKHLFPVFCAIALALLAQWPAFARLSLEGALGPQLCLGGQIQLGLEKVVFWRKGSSWEASVSRESSIRYFRKPLRGPPTHGVPKPPSNKKRNSKKTENPDDPQK